MNRHIDVEKLRNILDRAITSAVTASDPMVPIVDRLEAGQQAMVSLSEGHCLLLPMQAYIEKLIACRPMVDVSADKDIARGDLATTSDIQKKEDAE